MLVLLMTAVSGAWGQEESYLYLEVNPGNNTATLKYGSVQGTTPYYNDGNSTWNGIDDSAKSSVTTITVDASCKDYAGTSLHEFFKNFTVLTTINGLDNLSTASVTDMGGMFEGCSLLTSLTFGEGWNTEKVQSMRNMFYGCSQLTSLTFGEGWKTANVTDMSSMFYNCGELASLDLSGWNTENVYYMNNMFAGCSKLASLDLSGWNTSMVTDMSWMFIYCSSLTSLDLSGWNTEKVESMYKMFKDCKNLASLDLSSWNTGSVTNMSYMFRNCSSLASLDLSGWNTANVNNMKEMFRDCSSLENIYVGDGWSTKKVNNTWSSDMFKGCTSLPNWNENATDATKAYVGAGGYLTSWTQENLYLYLKVNSDNKAVLRYGQVPASTPYYVGGDDNVWSGDLAKSSVTTITVDATCKHFAGTTLRNLFNGFSALTTINGLTNLYTASVTDMIGMFSGCSKLASLDLSGWNTAKVTDMSGMFYDCKNLATLTFGDNWSTAGVNGMVSMFNGCSSLASLDLSSWNTGSVTDMSLMFLGCSSLASLTFGEGWNTGSVTDMSCMFFACSQLENIYVGNGWSTENVTSSDNMFKGCTKLPNWDENATDASKAKVGEGGYLTAWGQENLYLYLKVNSEDDTAVLRYGQVPANTPYYDGNNQWVGDGTDAAKNSVTAITVEASCQHFAGTSLYNLFSGFKALTTINDLENLNTAKVTDMSDMFFDCSSLASLDVSGWNTANVTYMSYMFLGCSSLASLDLSGWNTASVTDMSNMFNGCSALASLDLSGWNTENVYYMNDMFASCSNLASLTFGEGWNTGSVTNMSYMFNGCSSLASLDLSGWNTANVTDMSYMFLGCSSLASLDLSGWNTANVTYMNDMFNGCSSLATLDLSGWNTAKVTHMLNMFDSCSQLVTLDLSSWNTGSVTNMRSMFNGCSDLASLTFGEGWNTGKVESMNGMFRGCSSLETLDLSSWNTAKVTDMHEMFNGCSQLKNIYVGYDWSTKNVTEPKNSEDMFASCDNLPNWDEIATDATKAYVGDGGYLTSSNLYLEVDPQNNTLATLRYGQVPDNTPYYVGGDNNVWSGDPAKSGVKTITVAESCKHFAGTTLSNLFFEFTALTTINGLENLNTGSVTDMNGMFRDCSSLASLTFGEGWNTGSVTDMNGMFFGCSQLVSLDVSGWNTESVTDMYGMFYDCKNLATLTFGDNWSTAGVNGMAFMFSGCSSLASLDVSGWNTAKVTNMYGMFNGCSKLENIYVGDGWSTDKVTSSDDMFKGCTKLPNWDGTTDKTHADTGQGGYLTATTYNVQAHQGAQGEFWATFYSKISNYQAPEGTQVFTVILDGTSITMKEIEDGIVESGQGVVLKASTADGVNLTPTDDKANGDFSGNSLQGTATSIQNPGNAYVLNYKEGTGAGFYKLSSTGTIGANKAYLTYGSPAQEEPVGAPAFFSFDNTTGIVEMRNEGNEWNGGNGENAIWYDLNGRRLQGKPAQKGLYIVNGKKVIIK